MTRAGCKHDKVPCMWLLRYERKPINLNAERASNRWERAKNTKEWRDAFHWIAKSRLPRMNWMTVTVVPYQARGKLADTAAAVPSVKAAIDGIVDAGILPDDSGDYVREIRFLPVKRGKDMLELHIEGEQCQDR